MPMAFGMNYPPKGERLANRNWRLRILLGFDDGMGRQADVLQLASPRARAQIHIIARHIQLSTTTSHCLHPSPTAPYPIQSPAELGNSSNQPERLDDTLPSASPFVQNQCRKEFIKFETFTRSIKRITGRILHRLIRQQRQAGILSHPSSCCRSTPPLVVSRIYISASAAPKAHTASHGYACE